MIPYNYILHPKRSLIDAGRLVRAAHNADPARFWQRLLFASFWFSIFLFPIGYGFREVMPPLCLIFLGLYYRNGWKGSVLASLGPAWLFLCPLLMTILAIAFSIHPWDSLLHAGTGVNKGFILPFIGMECVKSLKDLQRLVWAFVGACFWEGLDGIYQALTGVDIIFNYPPNAGRLTGSLGDYTVGNYLSLALIPAAAVWFILKERLGLVASSFLWVAALWPAFYTIQGAATRSGFLALFAAAFFFFLLLRGLKNFFTWLAPALVFLAFWLFQPGRLSVQLVVGDNRWDLWRLAWAVFKEHMWLGAGPGQYNAAFRALNLQPVREVITISHPHNLYIDLLYAHGIIGFALAMTFLGGFLFWGLAKLRRNLRLRDEPQKLYWRLATFFWLGYAGWLVNGIFGHDFYRIWWLAEAMTSMGIMIGAIVWGEANMRGNAPPEDMRAVATGPTES